METLAHFTDDTTKGDWVELITDIDGLVNLCVKAGLPLTLSIGSGWVGRQPFPPPSALCSASLVCTPLCVKAGLPDDLYSHLLYSHLLYSQAGLPDDPETNPLKKELLYAIIEIYETMRQCEV